MVNEIIGSKLKLALDNLESLPAMPDIAMRLLALSLDTDEGEAQMLRLVEQDPQIFARLVGLANSSALGVSRKINGIQDAAMLLGMQRLKSVAIGIATMSKMLNQPAGKNFDPHDLWTHSMTVAIVMNTVAQAMPRRIRPDDNQIFLAGLLHDIGLMALHHIDPEASDELHRQVRLQPRVPIAELEMELFGMTHGYIGAQLVRHWHLPVEIIEVVELHHERNIGEVSLSNPLVRLVNIAEKLLPDFGFAEHTFDPIEDREWHELCIDSTRAADLSELANELGMQVVQLPEAHVTKQSGVNVTKGEETPPSQKKPVTPVQPATPTAWDKPSSSTDKSSFIFAPLRWIGSLFGRLFR